MHAAGSTRDQPCSILINKFITIGSLHTTRTKDELIVVVDKGASGGRAVTEAPAPSDDRRVTRPTAGAAKGFDCEKRVTGLSPEVDSRLAGLSSVSMDTGAVNSAKQSSCDSNAIAICCCVMCRVANGHFAASASVRSTSMLLLRNCWSKSSGHGGRIF